MEWLSEPLLQYAPPYATLRQLGPEQPGRVQSARFPLAAGPRQRTTPGEAAEPLHGHCELRPPPHHGGMLAAMPGELNLRYVLMAGRRRLPIFLACVVLVPLAAVVV